VGVDVALRSPFLGLELAQFPITIKRVTEAIFELMNSSNNKVDFIYSRRTFKKENKRRAVSQRQNKKKKKNMHLPKKRKQGNPAKSKMNSSNSGRKTCG
jgi:hypothetical protein